MATTAQKIQRAMNDEFADQLDAAFRERFDITLETRFDLLSGENGALISTRTDGSGLTREQKDFVETWTAGYHAAMAQVRA